MKPEPQKTETAVFPAGKRLSERNVRDMTSNNETPVPSGTPTRLAVIAIVVEEPSCTAELNAILHDYSNYIIGRMGVPYRQKKVSLISVAIDAPGEVISALTGKLGKLKGLNVKTAYSKL